jgi:hypothetical protein
LESIYGVDTYVVPLAPRVNFSTNFSKLPEIEREIFHSYEPDVKQLDRQLIPVDLVYYSTGLLWLKLLDVKSKQGMTALTSAEKDLRKGTQDVEFNVPQPIQAYLAQIGSVTDKMGKQTYLDIPPLPVTTNQGLGGYHSAAIDAETHNLYEEITCLGVAGDMLMAAASPDDIPNINVRVAIPAGSVLTENVAGYTPLTGPRRVEIRQRLFSYGITPDAFPEFVTGTRFDLKYMSSISDRIGQYGTFRNERVCFSKQTVAGGKS